MRERGKEEMEAAPSRESITYKRRLRGGLRKRRKRREGRKKLLVGRASHAKERREGI